MLSACCLHLVLLAPLALLLLLPPPLVLVLLAAPVAPPRHLVLLPLPPRVAGGSMSMRLGSLEAEELRRQRHREELRREVERRGVGMSALSSRFGAS